MSPDASEELAKLAWRDQYVEDACEEIEDLMCSMSVVHWSPGSMSVVDPLMKALRARGFTVSFNTFMLEVSRP